MTEKEHKRIKSNKLNKMQHHVTQEAGTEPPFSGKLLHNQREGIYYCLCCHAPLFLLQTKFDTGCGWPSFYQPINDQAVSYIDNFPTVCSG